VIHAVSDEQDMRNMGGLRTHIPITYWMMVIGTLALTGFPFTAGYYSKDAIIESAFASHNPAASYAFLMTIVAAAMTSFYSWRLIFMTFHGRPRASAEVMRHVHESPPVMTVPLALLALGALLAGLLFYSAFIGEESGHEFWKVGLFFSPENHILEEMHHVPFGVKVLPFLMMALGLAMAYLFYLQSPEIPRRLAERHQALYKFLLNKWYFDEIYDFLFVRPAMWLGRFLWKKGDGWFIDGFGPDGVSAWVLDMTNRVVRLQTGYLYHYAFAMLIGIAALITWAMFT
jgi:NADH-quinone oxidoreductase subunit L